MLKLDESSVPRTGRVRWTLSEISGKLYSSATRCSTTEARTTVLPSDKEFRLNDSTACSAYKSGNHIAQCQRRPSNTTDRPKQ